jgi:hypothetical protein
MRWPDPAHRPHAGRTACHAGHSTRRHRADASGSAPAQYFFELQLVEGRAESAPKLVAESRPASASYFATMGILCSRETRVPTPGTLLDSRSRRPWRTGVSRTRILRIRPPSGITSGRGPAVQVPPPSEASWETPGNRGSTVGPVRPSTVAPAHPVQLRRSWFERAVNRRQWRTRSGGRSRRSNRCGRSSTSRLWKNTWPTRTARIA